MSTNDPKAEGSNGLFQEPPVKLERESIIERIMLALQAEWDESDPCALDRMENHYIEETKLVSKEEWALLVDEAKSRWRPKDEPKQEAKQEGAETEDLYRQVTAVDFPSPARKEAFHGIAGKLTQAICKGSSLKPEAVLAQFLCIFGNMLGRGLYIWQEERHGTLINTVIVGNTAGGAKGGSLSAVKRVMREVHPVYCNEKFTGGHNSSEAILEEICDEVKGKDEYGDEVVKDAEVPDKRLVIMEPDRSRCAVP